MLISSYDKEKDTEQPSALGLKSIRVCSQSGAKKNCSVIRRDEVPIAARSVCAELGPKGYVESEAASST